MFIKATVTAVDLDKGVCKCRREGDGFTLINVTWALPIGGSGAPASGDPVWLYRDGGHFVIFGVRSRPGAKQAYVPSLTNIQVTSPVGDISSIEGTSFGSGGSPDELVGDKVLRSKGGAVVAALRGGSVIAKASALAWVFISKFDHLVKIFSRNYEKHNEARSEVNVNSNGRVFSVEENYHTQQRSRDGVAEHEVITGDVSAGELLGINYRGGSTEAATDNVIRRENITVEGDRLFQSDLNLDGELTEVSQLGSDSVTTTHKRGSYTITLVSGGVVQTFIIDPGKILLDSGEGASTLELKPDGTVLITGTIATVDVPNTTFTGNVAILGNATVAQGLAVTGASTMTAGITLGTGADVTSPSGVTLLTHHHTTAPSDGTAHTHVVNGPTPA